jgi:hypothetical protein
MTTIESKKVDVNASQQEVFDFLIDLNNLKELLPQDKISDWRSTADSCSFKVMGAYTIGLEKKSESAPDQIVLKSTENSPFPFTLDIGIAENGSNTTAGLVSQVDVNPFMKMMVQKPLQNLFDYIAEQLHLKYN